MTRLRRNLLLWSLVALCGLAALLFAAPLLLNTERYRGMLAVRASRLLNREVTAKSLRVHLLPRPGATVQGLTVADRAPWSGSFIEAERFDVSLKLLPLLRGELQIRKIRIDRPRIRLAREADGWNLDDLIRRAARPASAEPRREDARSVKGQPTLPVLLAGALAIRDGTLLFESPTERHGPVRREIQGLDVDVTAPVLATPLHLHASGRLPGEAPGSFDLTGSIRVEEGDRLPIEATLKVHGFEAAQLASYVGLSGASASAVSGTIDLEGKVKGEWPRIDVQADLDLQQVGVALGKEAGKAPGEKAWLRAKGRWDGNTFDMPEASLQWKSQVMTGRLTFANVKAPKIRFEVNTPELALEPLLAVAAGLGSGAGHSSAPRTPRRAPRTPHPAEGATQTDRFAGVQVQGRLQAGALRLDDLVLSPAEGELHYAGGLLTIRRLKGGFYGGTLSGEVVLDGRGQLPHTSITAHLEGVQTEPLLR
ncbi:MAG: AsmA family protein, partial [candidate division NC10 bacterium]|nr:AsmA family protein [candidate division NC10 bacterium]